VSTGLDLAELLALSDDPETTWMSWAICPETDPTLFDSTNNTGAIRKAKRICANCPVRDECLEWAIERDERGIWGGLTEPERRRYQANAA